MNYQQLLEDFTQLLRAEISQSEQRISNDFHAKLLQTEQRLRSEIGDTEQRLRKELSDTEQRIRDDFHSELSDTEQRIRDDFHSELMLTEQRLMRRIGDVSEEMREGFRGVGQPIVDLNDEIENHDKRLKVLELKLV
jgi:gas vesicle protein